MLHYILTFKNFTCENTEVFKCLYSKPIFVCHDASVHSVLSDSETPRTVALQVSLSITNSCRLLKLMSIKSAIQPSHPLSPPSSPAFNLSQHQGLFQWVSSLHQVAKVLEFSFSNSPSREYSALISCMIDWFDLLAVQETLKSLLQYLIQKHQFFGAQPSLWSKY